MDTKTLNILSRIDQSYKYNMKLTTERLKIIEPCLRKNPKAFDGKMKGLQQLAEMVAFDSTPDTIEQIR